MLILARKTDESIVIDDRIEVSIVEIKGDQVKLGIKAPKSVKIYRMEVYKAIQEENRKALESQQKLPSLDEFVEESAEGDEKGGASKRS
jgi:carbon storage regulator